MMPDGPPADARAIPASAPARALPGSEAKRALIAIALGLALGLVIAVFSPRERRS